MEKKFKVLGFVAVVVIFVISIGYGVSLVRLDNQQRVSRLVHQGQTEIPIANMNEKLRSDLAHAQILLMNIEDQKKEGKNYSPSEEKELKQFIADLQATLEKKQK